MKQNRIFTKPGIRTKKDYNRGNATEKLLEMGEGVEVTLNETDLRETS